MKQEYLWRYNLVGAVLFVMPVMIFFQVLRITTNPTQVEQIIEEGKFLSGEYKTITPARGKIYDRWGHLLAGNKTAYEVGIELNKVSNPETIAQTLNLVLGIDYSKALGDASLKASDTSVYRVVARSVSQEKVEQLKQLIVQMDELYGSSREKNAPSLRGLVFKPHLQRTYPEKDLGSNILGFVRRDGAGFYGVEEKYNDLLAGDETTIWVPLDPNRVRELPEITEGASLVLTIDRLIQKKMQEILDEALIESGSEGGTIVVLEPGTGEIIALATTPRLDANEYWNYPEVFTDETPYNKSISQAYEPGSVYKVFTMAAALDLGAVTPDTKFLDTGVFEIGGTRIYNWNMGAWGPQNMQGCMQHSLNVCLAWIASKVGPKDFYRYMQAFGIGHLTGVDLAGEVTGRLKMPGDEDWYDADLGTNAFGQGVAVTPIQMAIGAASFANDGMLMAPHIVRSVVNGGYQYDIEKRVIGMPIRAETADILSKMLARSLETESSDALVTGYRIAGKTGTAEIPTPFGYTTNETNASFVGWGPIDDPRFLVYVWLERPQSSPWGSVVAAPVFRKAVEELVVLIDLPPDDIREKLQSN